MDENMKSLINEFSRINNKGWIKSKYKSYGNVGLTFESEINKKVDSMFFPDYKDIEIKCSTRFSRYPLHLFNTAFDGPTFPEINRIIEKYGYPDKDINDKNIFIAKLNCKNLCCVNNNLKFRFEIDKEREILILCVYNKNNELIERESFVYLDKLKDHLCLKLNKLALIKASKKVIDGDIYYRYYSLELYKLKSFETFLNLLERGIVEISIVARLTKSGDKIGTYSNKSLDFSIKKNFISLLFDKIHYLEAG